jgi:protein subunit release factor A
MDAKEHMKQKLFSITKKDLRVDTFCSGGKGGQHQNKVESGVRIIHIASGAIGESRSERSQHQNKRIALEHLAASTKFKAWCKLQAAMLTQGYQDVEHKVDEMMRECHLKIEFYNPEQQ